MMSTQPMQYLPQARPAEGQSEVAREPLPSSSACLACTSDPQVRSTWNPKMCSTVGARLHRVHAEKVVDRLVI